MKAKKIWIAQHPNDPETREMSFEDKTGESHSFAPSYYAKDGEYGNYKLHVIIGNNIVEVEDE